jgi:hypothetical protein
MGVIVEVRMAGLKIFLVESRKLAALLVEDGRKWASTLTVG